MISYIILAVLVASAPLHLLAYLLITKRIKTAIDALPKSDGKQAPEVSAVLEDLTKRIKTAIDALPKSDGKHPPEVSAVLEDLRRSGHSIIRIDPDSILIRNRLR